MLPTPGGPSPVTSIFAAAHTHLRLAKALNDAVRRQHIYRNPCHAGSPPHPFRRELAPIESQGIQRLLAAAHETDYYALCTPPYPRASDATNSALVPGTQDGQGSLAGGPYTILGRCPQRLLDHRRPRAQSWAMRLRRTAYFSATAMDRPRSCSAKASIRKSFKSAWAIPASA